MYLNVAYYRCALMRESIISMRSYASKVLLLSCLFATLLLVAQAIAESTGP
jgi:hypothetical protein